MADKNRPRTRSEDASAVNISEDMLNKICSKQAGTIMDQLKPTINGTIMELMQPMINKMDMLMQKFKEVETVSVKQHKQIVTLERKCDELEQYTRRNSLRIYGIVETGTEDTSNLLIKFFAEKMKINISLSHIDRAHRIGAKAAKGANSNNKPRPIIAKFVSYQTRATIFNNKRVLKNTGYTIKEDLTQARHQLLTLAVKKFGVRNVWTLDGRIIVLCNNKKAVINHQDDIPSDVAVINHEDDMPSDVAVQ